MTGVGLRAGPKGQVRAEPLDLSRLGTTRAARCIRFIESYCRVPKGTGARRPVRLRGWQRRIVREVLRPGVRNAVVSLARGNGKSSLAAFLALWAFVDGPEGAQVLCVGGVSERQARHVFNAARRMVELNPDLAERVQVFADRLYMPHHDATLAPLPADADALQGFDPSFAVVDELAVVDERTYEAMSLAAGKRSESTLLAISTPPLDPDSVMRRLVDHGRLDDDPAFALVEYGAPEGCAVDDRKAWRAANPALGDFLAEDALAAVCRTTREAAFRQYRLGQWVSDTGAWLPAGVWADIADPARVVPDGAEIVLGFDGSYARDSTALVGCTVGDDPHLVTLGCWEAPEHDPSWRVPRGDVEAVVDAAFARYRVRRMACDPWGWQREVQEWADRYGADVVAEYPTNSAPRIGPATDALYQAIAERMVTHDGDARLARHVAHVHVRTTSAYGDVVAKDKKHSPRRIDLAIAAIVAFDQTHSLPVPRSRTLVTF